MESLFDRTENPIMVIKRALSLESFPLLLDGGIDRHDHLCENAGDWVCCNRQHSIRPLEFSRQMSVNSGSTVVLKLKTEREVDGISSCALSSAEWGCSADSLNPMSKWAFLSWSLPGDKGKRPRETNRKGQCNAADRQTNTGG
jgi:hypothetical protein